MRGVKDSVGPFLRTPDTGQGACVPWHWAGYLRTPDTGQGACVPWHWAGYLRTPDTRQGACVPLTLGRGTCVPLTLGRVPAYPWPWSCCLLSWEFIWWWFVRVYRSGSLHTHSAAGWAAQGVTKWLSQLGQGGLWACVLHCGCTR